MPKPPIAPQASPPQVTDPTQQRANAAIHQRLQSLEQRTADSVGGTYLGRVVLTGNGVGIDDGFSSATRCLIRMCGGGGGGGNAVGGSSGFGAGGGGAAGDYVEILVDGQGSALSVGAFNVGAGGAAGGSTIPLAGGGGPGGNTTIVVGGTTYTAAGGNGGTAMSATASSLQVNGGTSGKGSTSKGGVLLQSTGTPGVCLAVGTGNMPLPGIGGSNPFGQGGVLNFNIAAGANGQGFGSGGAGGLCSTVGQTGGIGAIGTIVLDLWL